MSAAGLRWVVFTLGVSAFWLSFFHRVAPAALAGELTAAFDVTGAALGALAATYFYVYALMQLPTGVLADTLGPRKTLAAGSCLAGIGSLLFAAATDLATAAAGRTLVGLGVSVAFVCVMKLNANWFDDRRFATMTALANVVGIVGAFAATVPLAWLITVVCWRTVFAAVGGASLALSAITLWKVQDSPERSDARTTPWKVQDSPEHSGARTTPWKVQDSPAAAETRPRDSGEPWHLGLAAVVRNRATWAGLWVNFGLSGVNMSFVGLWAVPFLMTTYGMSAVAASRHTSLMLAGYACSTALVGWWSDRMRRRRPLIVASGVLYLACWGAWIVGVPDAWTYVVAVVMGAVVSGFSLSWACAKEVNAPRYAGMATSLANVGGFLAAGILQPLVGWVLDSTGSYRAALGVLALFTCVGLAGALFIRETRCRNIWTPPVTG